MEEKLINLAGADGFFSSTKELMFPDKRHFFFLDNKCYCGNFTTYLQVT